MVDSHNALTKNNSITLWRIFFAYVIATFHLLNSYGYSTSLYLATDFFFIVSGFLLAYDISRNKYENALMMIIHKIKNYYPHYIFSLLIALIVFQILGLGPRFDYKSFCLEVLMLQMAGVNLTTLINVPTWYISVLLIASFFIFYLYKFHRRLYVEFIIPLFCLITGSWFWRNYGNLRHSTLGLDITEGIYWNKPLLIGFGMLSIGVLIYEIFKKVNISECVFGGGWRVIECLLLIGSMILAMLFKHNVTDFAFVTMIALGVLIAFINGECKWADNGVIKYFSKLSFSIYLNHNMFREVAPYYASECNIWVFVGYLFTITVYSMLTMFIVNEFIKFYERKLKKWQKQSPL